MKKFVVSLSLALALSSFANAGVLAGAASDVKFGVKVATFPVVHPVKTVKGAYKGTAAVVKVVAKV